MRFGEEEQRRERALTYKTSRSKRYKACSDVVRAWGLEPQRRKAREPKGSVTLVKDFLLAQHHAYVLNFTGYYACETKEIATRDYGLTYGYYYKLSKIVFNA